MDDITLRSVAAFLRDNPASRVELVTTVKDAIHALDFLRGEVPNAAGRVIFRAQWRCQCGWRGASSELVHGVRLYRCPSCGHPEPAVENW